MSKAAVAGVVLDAGAFIAVERRSFAAAHRLKLLLARGAPLVTSAGVVAQVWRGGASQAPIAFLLRRSQVVDLTGDTARLLGRMLAATGQSDPIDAHVVHLARERDWTVLTSDPDDLRALDATIRLELV